MTAILTHLSTTGHATCHFSFGTEAGLLDIVAFIGTRCRDAKMRGSAEDWLRAAARTEGQRHGLVSAHIIRAWRELEERDCALRSGDGIIQIPETKRRRLLFGARYHDARVIRLAFVRHPYAIELGAQIEDVWISEATGASQGVWDAGAFGLPDVCIGPCGTAFMDGREQGGYHHVTLDRFFFATPRT